MPSGAMDQQAQSTNFTADLRQAEADLWLAREAVNRAITNAGVPFRDILITTAETISRTEELLATVRRVEPIPRDIEAER
jgi:hypothetical protein